MAQLITVFVILAGLAIAIAIGVALARPDLIKCLLAALAAGDGETLPYKAREALLTPTERDFLLALRQAVGSRYAIAPKVRLADVLTCDREAWNKGFGNKIISKHLDFVLYDPESTQIRAGIELDDRSHRRRDRQDRDAFLEAAMEVAGIPLVRFPARRSYVAGQIADALTAAMAPPDQAAPSSGSVRRGRSRRVPS